MLAFLLAFWFRAVRSQLTVHFMRCRVGLSCSPCCLRRQGSDDEPASRSCSGFHRRRDEQYTITYAEEQSEVQPRPAPAYQVDLPAGFMRSQLVGSSRFAGPRSRWAVCRERQKKTRHQRSRMLRPKIGTSRVGVPSSLIDDLACRCEDAGARRCRLSPSGRVAAGGAAPGRPTALRTPRSPRPLTLPETAQAPRHGSS